MKAVGSLGLVVIIKKAAVARAGLAVSEQSRDVSHRFAYYNFKFKLLCKQNQKQKNA